MDTLRSVLLRVQETLKEAAALIEAYRKQGKIARRLKTSNTQNFETMAGKITSCSSDLMMSLQIQQTGDLSILKRAVPRDLVAENFIKEHGGQDAINVRVIELVNSGTIAIEPRGIRDKVVFANESVSTID
jgi:hypothetical protein